MTYKIFKKTLSEKLKRGLVIGAALLTLGTPKAHADGFLERATEIVKNASDKVGKFNSKVGCLNIAIGKFEKNIDRVEYNMDTLLGISSLTKAQKAVRTQVKQNGTYQATVQDFSSQKQTSQTSNSTYLHNVQRKLNKKSTESTTRSVQNRTTQQTPKRKTQNNVYAQDVQKVLEVLNRTH